MSLIASFEVDPQKGFTPLCPDELPVPGGDEIVEELNKQSILADMRIVSKDAHPVTAFWIAKNKDDAMQPIQAENMDLAWPAHCIVGSKGFDLIDGLPRPEQYDFIIYKGLENDIHPYGACYHNLAATIPTGVIEFLLQHDVETIIVGGLATDYCVKTTAMQLKADRLRVIVNLGACRGVNPETTAKAIEVMKTAGIEMAKDSMEASQLLEKAGG